MLLSQNSLSDTKLDHLQHLQDRARTLIENAYSKDGWVCNSLSVTNFAKYGKAVMTCKILNNFFHGSLRGKFTMRSQISVHKTRNCHDITIPKHNLEFSKRSFHYSAAKLWNEIPLQMRNSSTIFAFKRKLKEYLLHWQFRKSTVSRKSSILISLKLYLVAFFV